METTFQACVGEATARGTSVLLSSHILDEVERLCDRVSIVRSGRTVESGSLADLRHLTRTTVVAETRTPATQIARLPGTHRVELDGARVSFDVDTAHLGGTIEELGRSGILSLTSHPPTLEELFLRHYGTHVEAVSA